MRLLPAAYQADRRARVRGVRGPFLAGSRYCRLAFQIRGTPLQVWESSFQTVAAHSQ